MNQTKKNLLLAVLAILLAVKFVIQPWLEYLEEQKQELQTLTKKLNRSESLLLVQAEVEANEQRLQQVSDQLLQGVASASDAAAYRIQFQQQLQTMMESHNVQLVLFEWLSDAELHSFSVSRGRLSLRLKGNLADVAKAHLAIEVQLPYVHIRDLKANWQGPLQPGQVIELAALAEVDYKVEQQP